LRVWTLKYFLRIFLPVAVLIVLGAFWLKLMDDRLALVTKEAQEDVRIARGVDVLSRRFETVYRDLRFHSHDQH